MNHHVFDWKFYISYYKDLRDNGIINERLAIMHLNGLVKMKAVLQIKKCLQILNILII